MTSLPVSSSYAPIVARSSTTRARSALAVYDCIRIIAVQAGTAILVTTRGQHPVAEGDVVLLAAGVPCGWEPEGTVTLTTIYLDPDYVTDLVFWQHGSILPDRHCALAAMNVIYPEPVQVIHLGKPRSERLAPLLDELIALGETGYGAERFFRIQALVSLLTDAIFPHITRRPPPITTWNGVHLMPVVPRWRQFRPVRREAIAVEALLRSDVSQRWTLAVLCDRVHLSDKQLVRVFVDAYGKTPNTYLTMLRVEEMARLLRETDIPVTLAVRRVGWNSRSHATDIFRRHIGVTPARYRHYGPPSNAERGGASIYERR